MMSAAHAQSASAWIELKPLSGNVVQVTGHALALDAVKGMHFSLSLRRQNKGNTSSTRQAGRFDLPAGDSKVLSTTSINVEPGDELVIELKVLDHGQEVSSATLSSRPPSGKSGQSL